VQENRPKFGKWQPTSNKLQKNGLCTDIDSPSNAINEDPSTIFIEEETKLEFSKDAFSKSLITNLKETRMRVSRAISTYEEDGFEILPDDILYLEDRTIHGWIDKLSKI
jgi:hypothetical protein